MAIQKINLGTEPHGVGGDSYRTANDKINKNFEEVSANITNVDEKYSNTEVKITEEVARAKQVEDELKSGLEKEVSRAVSAEADILGVVESESKARTAENIRINEAQTQLKSLVDSEVEKLKLEDTSIKTDLDKTHRYAVMSQTLGLGSKFYDKDGQPLSDGKVYTYEAGTSTLLDTYKDADFNEANTNPIILDETGSADVFLKGTYRFRIFDKDEVFVEEQDNVSQVFDKSSAKILSDRLDALPFEGGVLADTFIVVDGTTTQAKINKGFDSLIDLFSINNPKNGLRVYAKSFYKDGNIGGGFYYWDRDIAKSEANGGYIVDPSSIGGFDGTPSTLAQYMSAQGTGTGKGCWVASDVSFIDTTRFGVSIGGQDSSPAIQAALEYAAKRRGSNVVLPSGSITVNNKISIDFKDGDVLGAYRSLTLVGQKSQTQIFSNVTGDNTFEFIDADSVSCKDFTLYGNNKTGAEGNGHGIAYLNTGTSGHKPSNCVIDGITVRRFKGNALYQTYDIGNFTRPAAGLYIGGGLSTVIKGTSAIENYFGIYIYNAQQTALENCITFRNTFTGLLADQCVETILVDNGDYINIEQPELELTLYSAYSEPVKAANIVFYRCDAAVVINSVKFKGDSVYGGLSCHVFSFGTRSIYLNGCHLKSTHTGKPSVYVQVGRTTPTDLIVRGCTITSAFASDAVSFSGVLFENQLNTTDFCGSVTFEDNTCILVYKWNYVVNIKPRGSSDLIRININNNTIRTHKGSSYDAIVDTVFNIARGHTFGCISGNTILAEKGANSSNQAKITKIYNRELAPHVNYPDNMISYNNSIKVGVGAEITNKSIPADIVDGLITLTIDQAVAGNLKIPVNLFDKPKYVHIALSQEQRTSKGIIQVYAGTNAGQKANEIFARVFEADGTTPYSGQITVYYRASTGARSQS